MAYRSKFFQSGAQQNADGASGLKEASAPKRDDRELWEKRTPAVSSTAKGAGSVQQSAGRVQQQKQQAANDRLRAQRQEATDEGAGSANPLYQQAVRDFGATEPTVEKAFNSRDIPDDVLDEYARIYDAATHGRLYNAASGILTGIGSNLAAFPAGVRQEAGDLARYIEGYDGDYLKDFLTKPVAEVDRDARAAGYVSRPLDGDSAAMRGFRAANQYKQTATAGLSEQGIWGTRYFSPKWLAEQGISVAENTGNLAASAVSPAVGTAYMIANAGGGRMLELSEQGVPAGTALTRGLVSGGIEALTEKYSIESLMDGLTNNRGALINILSQMGVEASEETASYVLNYAADVAARDPNAAFSVEELVDSALGGAFSGGVYGVGGQLGRKLTGNSRKNYDYARQRDGGRTPDFDAQWRHYNDMGRSGVDFEDIPARPSRTPLDAATAQGAYYAGLNDGAEEAKATATRAAQGGTLSDSQIDAMLGHPEAREQFARETGVALDGTNAENRAAVRDYAGRLTTGIDADPATHTEEQMKGIRAYVAAADQRVKSFFERYRNDPRAKFSRMTISPASARQAADVSRLLGGDYTGYVNAIDRNGVLHILNRHGANGEADSSMADLNDAARIGYVLDEYDSVTRALKKDGSPDTATGYMGQDNKPAPLVKFEKKINGSYYVVEAVPDSSYKKMWVVSAYIAKNSGDSYASADAEAPGRTSETSLTSPVSADLSIAQAEAESNSRDYANAARQSAQESASTGGEDVTPGFVRNALSAAFGAETEDMFDRLARRGGARIEIVESLADGANAVYQNDSIRVSAAALREDRAGALRSAVMHELTHHIETSGQYAALRDFVRNCSKEAGVNIDKVIADIREEYEKSGKKLSNEEGNREYVAQYIESFLSNEQSVAYLARENRGLFDSIREFLRDLVTRFRGTQDEKTMRELLRTFDRALDTVGENPSNRLGGAQNLIRRAEDGTQFVDVTEDILEGADEKDIPKILSDIVRSKFSTWIHANGQKIGVNQKTAKEWVRSRDAATLMRQNQSTYLDKMRAFPNADELLQASRGYVNEQRKHQRKDNFTEFARGVVNFRVGENDYSADIVVGITKSKAAILYDIVGLKKIKIAEASDATTAAQSTANRRHEASAIDSIPQTGPNGNPSAQNVTELTQAGKVLPGIEKRTAKLLRTMGLQYRPIELQQSGSMGSISYNGQNVNIEGVPFLNIVRDGGQKSYGASFEERLRRTGQEEALERLRAMNQRYGTFKRGESPARDVQMPRQTNDETRVRRYSRTAAEASALTDEQAGAIEQAVLDGRFNYEPIGDASARAHAESVLARGDQAAAEAWSRVVNGTGYATKNDIALGEYLLKKAAEEGDTARVVQLAAEIAAEGTRAGQVVQAMRLLKQMGGTGQLVSLDAMLKKMQGELDRGKSGVFLTVSEQLRQELADAKAGGEVNAALDKIYTELAAQMPVTAADRWNAWRYLSMLGNPRTHVRNFLGNAAFEPMIVMKNAVGALMEGATDAASRTVRGRGIERTKSLSGLLPFTGGETMRFAQADFQEVRDVITGGGKHNPTDIIREKQKVLPGFLETLRRKNGDFLEGEDCVFLEHHYVRALTQYLRANRVDVKALDGDTAEGAKVLNRAREYAIREAQKATYRDFSLTAQLISQASRRAGTAGKVLIEGVLPFKKTPINVLKRGVEYSPVGLAKTLTYNLGQLADGKISANEFIDGLAAGLTGSGAMLAGYFLAQKGWLTGGGDDDKEQAFLDALGHQSYALQWDGKTYTVDWVAPTSMPVFAGVELARLANNGMELNARGIWDAALSIAEPVTQMSMLDGLNSLIARAGYAENPLSEILTGAVSDYLGQAVPTLLGQIARTIDPIRRTTYDDKNSGIPSTAQKTWQKNANKVPFLSMRSAAYLDLWGQEQENGGLPFRVFQNFISPGYFKDESLSETESELIRLYRATGESAALPGTAAKSFEYARDGETVVKQMTAEEYQVFAETRGAMMYSGLSEMTSGKAYQALEDVDRAVAAGNMIQLANAIAKTGVSEYRLSGWYEKAVEGKEKYGISFAEFALARAVSRDDATESLKDKDGETIKNSAGLLKMQAIYQLPGLTDKQREYLFEACGVGKSIRHYNKAKVEEELRKMRKQTK